MNQNEIGAKVRALSKWMRIIAIAVALFFIVIVVRAEQGDIDVIFATLAVVYLAIMSSLFVLVRRQYLKVRSGVRRTKVQTTDFSNQDLQTKLFGKFPTFRSFVPLFTLLFGMVVVAVVMALIYLLAQLGVADFENLFMYLQYDQVASSNLFMLILGGSYMVALVLGVFMWEKRRFFNTVYLKFKNALDSILSLG